MFGWVRESRLHGANNECAKRRIENRELRRELDEQRQVIDLIDGANEVLLAEAEDLRGLLAERAAGEESLRNALHVRGRSIDYLVGEVDAAQEDARAAKALANFWMISWLSALSGDAPKEITS